MADDEDDYMSDKFLQNDTQPGLVPEIFARKRKHKEENKKRMHQNKTKPMKVREAEKRDEKLNKSIDESNKGFAMLSKMGFKKGMGLGKEGQGRVEPIPIDLKFGRKGLGTEEEEKRKKQKMEMAYVMRAKQKQVSEKLLKGDFLDRQRHKENEYQTKCDLYKSQKCCEQLDSTKGLEIPFPWAWPIEEVEDEVEDEEEDEEEDEGAYDDEEYEKEDIYTQLDLLTNYLRTTHKYCVWCGTSYNDDNDLNENCPGGTSKEHEES